MVQFKKVYNEDGSFDFKEVEELKLEDFKDIISEEKLDLKESDFNKMTKDGINDWAAKNGFDVDTKDKKKDMIKSLLKQME